MLSLMKKIFDLLPSVINPSLLINNTSKSFSSTIVLFAFFRASVFNILALGFDLIVRHNPTFTPYLYSLTEGK